MKKLLAATLCAAAFTAAAQTPATAADSLNTAAAQFIAQNMNSALEQVFSNFRSMGIEVDSATVVARIADYYPAAYDTEMHRTSGRILMDTADRLAATRGKVFLDAAAAQPGAVTLPSGVVIVTLREGSGDTVAPADTVSFYYIGTIPGGTVFDSVEAPADPLKGLASDFVPGLIEAFGHMKSGGKYIVTIPASLAYGERGAGGVIPPNTPISFQLEIVSVAKAPAVQQ